MKEVLEDFKEEFIEKYNTEEYKKVDNMINHALENCNYYDKSYETIDIHPWEISLSIEKHDALNFIYEIGFYNTIDETEPSIAFYTGVDVGCECIHYCLEGSYLSSTRTVNTLVDVIIDEESIVNYIANKTGTNYTLAYVLNQATNLLELHKEAILDIYRKQDYDNYVTGGGTTKTDKHYKKLKQDLNDKGLFWKCVYEEIEVERNLR